MDSKIQRAHVADVGTYFLPAVRMRDVDVEDAADFRMSAFSRTFRWHSALVPHTPKFVVDEDTFA